jgi:dihydrofolate synthase/folylpolyglutamate synthase
MNYKESIDWLNSFQRFGMKLGLKRISYICKELDNPQNCLKVIHVGGTNGKGSVCRFLESVLLASGYSVGVYTSPHLQRFSERIVVDGKEISERDVISLIKKIKSIVEKMTVDDNGPTYFEIVTAMAFQYFKDRNVDFAVVEVGLGGRFDATNVVNPVVSIITNVSLEHTDILGKKVEDISFEKAGIIKNNVPVVTSVQGKVLEVIEKIANERKAPVNVVRRDDWTRYCSGLDGQEFYVKGFLKDYNVKTCIPGKFQGENIALTLAVVEILQMNGFYVSDDSINDGISKTVHAGRMEVISREPIILLDGAHNPSSIKSLVDALKNDFDYDKLVVVLGILSDKDIKPMLESIVPLADVIVATKSSNARACDPYKLRSLIEELEFRNEIVVKDEIIDAVNYAKSVAKKKDLVCVTGSLFTVGEAMEHLQKR